MSKPRVYRLHDGARTALLALGVLLCLLVVSAPYGLWVLSRLRRGRVEITEDEVVANQVMHLEMRVRLSDIRRVGVMIVPVVARGIGGYLARKKCGGRASVNLCLQDASGKTRIFMASMYEHHEEIIQRVAIETGRPLETLTMGFVKPKWPDAAPGRLAA